MQQMTLDDASKRWFDGDIFFCVDPPDLTTPRIRVLERIDDAWVVTVESERFWAKGDVLVWFATNAELKAMY